MTDSVGTGDVTDRKGQWTVSDVTDSEGDGGRNGGSEALTGREDRLWACPYAQAANPAFHAA